MDEYWVYENWTIRPQKAVIHDGACRHCQHGKGQHGTTNEANGRWHGPYDSMATANATALQTGWPVRRCRICKPT